MLSATGHSRGVRDPFQIIPVPIPIQSALTTGDRCKTPDLRRNRRDRTQASLAVLAFEPTGASTQFTNRLATIPTPASLTVAL
jgi:hypothetical protein